MGALRTVQKAQRRLKVSTRVIFSRLSKLSPFYDTCLKNGPKFYMDEYVVPLNAIPALFYILYLVRLSSKLSYSRLRRLIANADIKRFKIVQDTPFEQ